MGGYLYLGFSAENELKAALAETDRLDPGWQLADLEAKRPRPPDRENSALKVNAAYQLIPRSWGSVPDYYRLFQDLPPEAQLNEPQLKALQSEMQQAPQVLELARQLADMPNGHHVINWSPDFISTLLPDIQNCRQVAELLRKDAMLRAQEKDPESALRAVKGVLNAGRSIGPAPSVICQLVRIAMCAISMHSLERTLAQGEPAPAALAELQHLLEEEDQTPTLLISLRGERAGYDQLLSELSAGHVRLNDIIGLGGEERFGPSGQGFALLLPGAVKHQRTAMLRFMNRAVEAAKVPPQQQKEQFEQLEASAREQPVLVRVLAPSMTKIAFATQRHHAQLRCAVVMLAAERYRQERKQWPESLAALVAAGHVKDAPTDPYDGTLLRYRRLQDGVVIYTVGPDLQDNGGVVDPKFLTQPGGDVGYRLWDPERRRQPAPPPPVSLPGGPQGLPGGLPHGAPDRD